MATMIYDPEWERELLAVREANGADRYDEVWEGVYVMSPMPNDEHQLIVSRLTRILDEVITDNNTGQVRAGVNVSDRQEDWKSNYRVPDVAVFLNDTSAVNRDTFWLGGPDLAIEVISPGEQIAEKIDFYSRVQTRELLIIERAPWEITLHRLQTQGLERIARITREDHSTLECDTVGIQLSLQAGKPRPQIKVSTTTQEGRTWTI